MKRIKRTKQAILKLIIVAIIISNLSFVALADGISGLIVLPKNIEYGNFTVTKDGTKLLTGDAVSEGETLMFTSTPDEKYYFTSGTDTGPKTLSSEDFNYGFRPITLSLENNTGWGLNTDNYFQQTDGYISTIRRDEVTTKSFVHTQECISGENTITFDWSVDQGYVGYGLFKLEFYHNNVLQITHDFTETANPYGHNLSDTYSFTSEGGDESFRWDFVKTRKGNWADYGRRIYINNLKLTDDIKIFVPGAPVFRRNVEIKAAAVTGGELTLSTTTALADDELSVSITPRSDDGYDFYGIILRDADSRKVIFEETKEGEYKFTVPHTDYVIFKPIFLNLENNAYSISTKDELLEFIFIADGAPLLDGILTADIDMENASISPICSSSQLIYNGTDITQKGYRGVFDGGNHTISNFTIIANENEISTGLFGTVSGTVKDLSLVSVKYDNNGEFDGRFSALCGMLLTDGKITNCAVYDSNISGENAIRGAIVGANYGGTIEYCVSWNNNTTVSGSRAGNLVGDNRNDDSTLIGKLNYCFSSKTVHGSQSGTVNGCQASIKTLEEVAWRLNTNNGTQPNAKKHSIDKGKVVISSINNQPILKLEVTGNRELYNINEVYYFKENTAYTFPALDGVVIKHLGNTLTPVDSIYTVIPTDDSTIDIDASLYIENFINNINTEFTLYDVEITNNFNNAIWTLSEDGVFQSGEIEHSQKSTLEMKITLPAETIFSFDWKASSEQGWDTLNLYLNGAQDTYISGDTGWENYQLKLNAGENTIRWTYKKDGSNSPHDDAVYLKNMAYCIIDSENKTLTTAIQNKVTASIVAAGYDENGKLNTLVKDSNTFNEDALSLDVSALGDFSLQNNIKLFIWDSLTGMNPIMNSIVIK